MFLVGKQSILVIKHDQNTPSHPQCLPTLNCVSITAMETIYMHMVGRQIAPHLHIFGNRPTLTHARHDDQYFPHFNDVVSVHLKFGSSTLYPFVVPMHLKIWIPCLVPHEIFQVECPSLHYPICSPNDTRPVLIGHTCGGATKRVVDDNNNLYRLISLPLCLIPNQ